MNQSLPHVLKGQPLDEVWSSFWYFLRIFHSFLFSRKKGLNMKRDFIYEILESRGLRAEMIPEITQVLRYPFQYRALAIKF